MVKKIEKMKWYLRRNSNSKRKVSTNLTGGVISLKFLILGCWLAEWNKRRDLELELMWRIMTECRTYYSTDNFSKVVMGVDK